MNDEKTVPQRCAPDDPQRCQSTAGNGQCPFLSVPGTQHCPIHGSKQNKALYQLNRTEVLIRLQEFKNHPDSRSLALELGLLRLLLEQIINKCDAYDLMTQSVQIITLIDKIKALQDSSIRLEQKLGDLLSIEQVTSIAQTLFNLVTDMLTDFAALQHTSNDMSALVPELLEDLARRFEASAASVPNASNNASNNKE